MYYERFMIFGTYDYEAKGGLSDVIKTVKTLSNVVYYFNNKEPKYDEYRVFDRIKGVEIQINKLNGIFKINT